MNTTEQHPSQISSELAQIQSSAVAVATSIVAPDVVSWAGPNSKLAGQSDSVVMQYCAAVRRAAQLYDRTHEGERPRREDREIARLGDVVVMSANLARENYFNTPQEVAEFTSAVADSGYDPRAVVRVVHDPRRLLDPGLDHIDPIPLSHVLGAWSQLADNVTVGPTEDKRERGAARNQTPSLGIVYALLTEYGVSLNYPVDDLAIDMISGAISTRPINVTSRLASDPHNDFGVERHEVFMLDISRVDGAATSSEHGWNPTDATTGYEELELDDLLQIRE